MLDNCQKQIGQFATSVLANTSDCFSTASQVAFFQIEKELNADNVPPVALSKSDELDDELLSDAVERLQRITSRESRRSKETAYPTPSTRQAKASTVSSDTPATSKDSKRLMS